MINGLVLTCHGQIKGYFVVVVAALASLILVSTATTQSCAQNEKYRAKLDGNNEVPPLNTTSEGVINFKTKSGMDDLENECNWHNRSNWSSYP